MENVKTLLDAVKAAKGIESDYALAKALDLSKQHVSAMYKGTEIPNEYDCLLISKALDKPLADVLAVVKIVTEKNEKRRAAWVEYYKSIGGIAAAWAVALFVSVTLTVTTPAEAAQNQSDMKSEYQRIQIMRLSKAFRRALEAAKRMLGIVALRVGNPA